MRRLATIEDFVVGTIFYSEARNFLRVKRVERINGIPSVVYFDDPFTYAKVSDVIGSYQVEYTPSTMSDLVFQAKEAVSSGDIKSFEFTRSYAGSDLLVVIFNNGGQERVSERSLSDGFDLFKPAQTETFPINNVNDIDKISWDSAAAKLANGSVLDLDILDGQFEHEYMLKILKGSIVTQQTHYVQGE